ncbi:MAG: PASTA domain-containing protein, partial [Bowdeniella nasicola]|nr:PASTA domain-containing protein [Bowdeniella nasicola]
GTGTVLGTVAYLAPEVISHGGGSPAADIYSVGILLYELLCGTVPFSGDMPIQVAMKHVNEDVPPISDTLMWVPREVDDLLAAFTARDVTDRDPSAQLALAHLQRVREQLSDEVLSRRADVASVINSHDIPQHASGDHGDTGIDHSLDTGAQHTAPFDMNTHATATITSRATAALSNDDSALVALPVGAVGPNPRHSPTEPPRKRRRWPIVLAVVTIVLLATAGTWWWFRFGPGSLAELPDVTGQPEAAATDMVRDANFAVQVERTFDDEVAEGHVIRTDPTAGKIPKDAVVTLWVSQGIRKVTIPKLVGRDAQEVLDELRAIEVAIGESVYEYSDSVPEGQVISASQQEGDVIPHNQAVILTISQGPEPITFPDLVGKTRDEAQAQIDALALQVTWEESFSDDIPADEVISQSPKAGSDGHRTDAISVEVSKGPELFEVPDVFGKSSAEARRILEEAGFQVEVSKVLGGVFGTVRSQDPSAGTKLPRGTTITITVV